MASGSSTASCAASLYRDVLRLHVRVGDEPVAEQQGELLIGPAIDADVDVGGAAGVCSTVDPFAPQGCVAGLWIVGGDVRNARVADGGECVGDLVGDLKRGDGDLDVDHVLGLETGYGRGADVVDPQCLCAAGYLDALDDPLRLPRPFRVVRHQLPRRGDGPVVADVIRQRKHPLLPQVTRTLRQVVL